jgi:hypothetical protein
MSAAMLGYIRKDLSGKLKEAEASWIDAHVILRIRPAEKAASIIYNRGKVS